eukprot:TRINITY_DN16831_c0_g1_i1.p1 TRINITY_DN16831_c0_g1~~TRINITY_DN16831_c0_g1_i1.p1  ORF type:complete len:430 (+),score=105.94 TRINITY_DN16831_c0_g1_i1:88-1377(+)
MAAAAAAAQPAAEPMEQVEAAASTDEVSLWFDWEEADRDRLRPVYTVRYREGHDTVVLRAAGLDAAAPMRYCSVGADHLALLPGRGGAQVMCSGENAQGQLGVGDSAARGGLCLTAPPLSAAAVCAGDGVTVALREDGTVCTWGRKRASGRPGSWEAPAAVAGLPRVAQLAMGGQLTAVLTIDDKVVWWGSPVIPRGYAWFESPRDLPDLSVHGITRIACSADTIAIETRQGELLLAHIWQTIWHPAKRVQHWGMRFPLRSLVCSKSAVAAADAAGDVWICGGHATPPSFELRHSAAALAQLPRRRPAVLLAAWEQGVVALTEGGELWDCRLEIGLLWRRIRAKGGERPLGLVPYGGPSAAEVVLAPDCCGGVRRLQLFARISMRIGVPSDPVREVLTPLVVHGAYIVGPPEDPFWRVHECANHADGWA